MFKLQVCLESLCSLSTKEIKFFLEFSDLRCCCGFSASKCYSSDS